MKTISIIIAALISVAILTSCGEKKEEAELEPLEFTIQERSTYGFTEEGYQITLSLDHSKYSEDDLRRLAVEVVKDFKDARKFEEFTIFIKDPDPKYNGLALFKLEAKEKSRNIKESSFYVSEIGSEAEKNLKQ